MRKIYTTPELIDMYKVELTTSFYTYSDKRKTLEEMLRMRNVKLQEIQNSISL